MSTSELSQGNSKGAEKKKPRKSRVGAAFKYCGLAVLLLLLVLLIINAMLSVFNPHYYPTFGKYRLFSIVSDSMEPAIKKGNMIVDKKPTSADEITVGTVITFEVENSSGDVTVLTHRVVRITSNPETGAVSYITKGDNAGGEDSIHPDYDDVIGIFTGKQCGFFGYFFGFFQSSYGALTLILVLFIILIAWCFVSYYSRAERRRKLEKAALEKSAQELSNVSLRYDNIREITAVMDVLGTVTEEPKTSGAMKAREDRLNEFVQAKNIELPQTPETAAVLDSLPAPDTPLSLVAALRSGATLRQAEDGQTLVLTGISGGKSILLTPVQTPDGIILCQQGVRLRSDLAPNIESLGAMSMPDYPEFFEGQPLEKNVEYPELPEPHSQTFGPEMLGSRADGASGAAPQLSVPTPVGQSRIVGLEMSGRNGDEPTVKQLEASAEKRNASALPQSGVATDESRNAYAQYRELAAQIELRQVEQLSVLLNETEPLSPEEKTRIAEYKDGQKREKAKKAQQPKKPLTPEQKAARKAAAEKRKAEHEAFVAALSPSERDLYLSEQKLSKARAATIRRLKRIAADRKILEKLGSEDR